MALHEEHRRLVSESRGGRGGERRRTDRHGRRFVWRHSRRNCFAGERRCTFSDDQSIRAREWVNDGNRGGIKSRSRQENASLLVPICVNLRTAIQAVFGLSLRSPPESP